MHPLRLRTPSTAVRDRRRASRAMSGGSRAVVAAALTATLLATGLPPLAPAGASGCDLTGSGTSGDPYLVTTGADLLLVGDEDCAVSAHYRQTADITVLAGFTPIGTVSAPFTGTYQGATTATRISGLVLSNPDVSASGTILALFAATQGATIESLTIHHPNITQQSNGPAAALIGEVRGSSSNTTTVRDVTIVNPSVDGRQDIGPLIGRAAAPVLIKDVTVTTASIQPTGDFNGSAGGLIGTAQAGATLRRVAVGGTVGSPSATDPQFDQVGAIIGTAAATPGAGLVLEDITVGGVGATFVRARELAGGMIGILTGSGSASIDSSGASRQQLHVNVRAFADAGRASAVGGIIGRVRDGASVSVSKVEVTGDLADNTPEGVASVGQLGGIIGDYRSPSAAATLTIDDVQVEPRIMWGGAAVGGAIGSAAAATGSPLTVTVSDSTFAPTDSVRAHSTMSELGGVIGAASGADLTVTIEDVAVDGTIEQWSQGPLGGAIGRAAGGVFTVTGLVVGSSSQLASLRSRGPAPFSGTAGVVGSLTGGRLTVDDADVNVDLRLIGDAVSGQNVAGILGSAAVPIASEVLLRGVRVRGHLEGASQVAGLVATAPSVPLDPAVPSLRIAAYSPPGGGAPIRSRVDATITTTIEGGGTAGGAVAGATFGTMRAEISGLDVTATAAIGGATAGGVVGEASGPGASLVVDDVTVAAAVGTSGETAGGIVATATDVSITNSSVSGTVRSAFVAGGFVGIVSGEGSALAISGGSFSGTVHVTAPSDVPNMGVSAGGLVGFADVVPAITGTVGTGGSVRADHLSGNEFGAVYLAGAVAQVTAAGATTFDTSSMAGMQVVDLGATGVSMAIRDAGRCIVSDRANLISGTTLVRSRPLSPDPCPEPPGGFSIFDDLDDDDDVTTGDDVNGGGSTAGGAAAVGDSEPGVTLTCSSPTAAPGAELTCTVAGAPADIDILWEVRRNPVVATGVVRTDGAGSGELSFRVPDLPAGTTLAVELVEWMRPLLLTIAGPVPAAIPAGEGPGALPSAPMRAAALAVLLLSLALAAGRWVSPSRRGRALVHQG